jgi:peptide/nickel transport system substrate-binding protein
VFEKFAGYIPRNEPPDGVAGARVAKVDRMEWILMPDATTAADALIKGEVDFWEQVSPDLAGMLRDKGITVRGIATLPTVAFIRPNFQLPPFNDVRARQALALLFDQSEMMEAAAGFSAPGHDARNDRPTALRPRPSKLQRQSRGSATPLTVR